MAFAFLVPHWQDLGFAPDYGCGREEAEGESLLFVKAACTAIRFPLWHVPGMREGGERKGAVPASLITSSRRC